MAIRTSYEPGTPSWVDLGATDVDAAAAFYGGLFGWDVQEGPPEAGGYRMCLLRGAPVAGIGPMMAEGQPPAWLMYITVADADATAAAVAGHGGSVLVGPMDVLDVGRMAVFADAVGAAAAVWQPRAHIGAGIVNEPSAFTWSEHMTRDEAAATAFYGDVFGWRAESAPFGEMAYNVLYLGDRPIGGLIAMGDETPADVPPHWAITFGVDDCDGAAARCRELGGAVLAEPADLPDVGRFASLSDPGGATFGVLASATWSD